jgi:hypothetical protein
MSRTFRVTDRAERLERIRQRALARDTRRMARMCEAWDQPVNPWAGRHSKPQRERIAQAERLARQARTTYVHVAREAYLAQRPEAAA